MILPTEKRMLLHFTVLIGMVALLLTGGLGFGHTLLAEENTLVDQREDLKACSSAETGCSSCRIQTVEELREKLSFIDILEASVRRTEGNNSYLVMELKVADSIPTSPRSLTSYSFALDLDGNSDTGFRADRTPLGVFPDLGVDLWVSLSFYQGGKNSYLFIGPNDIKKLNGMSGTIDYSIGEDRKNVVFTVPVGRIERKMTFAYLHVKPEFKLELEKTEWVAFTTRATVQYPKENPICDFHPDKYFKENTEGCLLSPLER